MIKSDRFDTTGLLPDPACETPHKRSLEEVARAKYVDDQLQNGNIHPGAGGKALDDDLGEEPEFGRDTTTRGSYIDRIDELC